MGITHCSFHSLPANENQAKNNAFTAALLKGINQQTLPISYLFSTLPKHSEKGLFAEDCIQYITGYRSIAQTALVAIQVASFKTNSIWTTGGYSGIAQTVLVAMPTVCPLLQI